MHAKAQNAFGAHFCMYVGHLELPPPTDLKGKVKAAVFSPVFLLAEVLLLLTHPLVSSLRTFSSLPIRCYPWQDDIVQALVGVPGIAVFVLMLCPRLIHSPPC